MKKLKLLLIIAILCLNYSYGQEKLTHFSKKDGLSSTWVRDCLEDKQGNMWFATDKGLCKFDGEQFECFTKKEGLPAKEVRQLFMDKNGIIFFTMEPENNLSSSLGGALGSVIGSLAKKGKAWGRYEEGKLVTNMNKNSSEYLWSHIANSDGDIWIGGISKKSKMGFFLINPDSQTMNPVTQLGGADFPPVGFFFCTGKDNIWISSSFGKGDYIFHFDGSNWTSYGEKDGLATKFRYKSIQTILEDINGNVWFKSSVDALNGGLMQFDGKNWTVYTEDNGVIGKGINKIVEDKDGNIWVGTNKGLNVFDGDSWKNYSEKDKLPHKFITAITVDSKGRVWIGTAGGLVLFDQGIWSTINEDNGITHNGIRSIGEDSRGNIWVGAGPLLGLKKGGVSIYDGTLWKKLDSEELAASGYFEDSKGNMWLLTLGNGVFRYEYEKNTVTNELN
jgi:ligand-binding sensor domain-containing protein